MNRDEMCATRETRRSMDYHSSSGRVIAPRLRALPIKPFAISSSLRPPCISSFSRFQTPQRETQHRRLNNGMHLSCCAPACPSSSPSRAVACSLDAVNQHSTDTLLHSHHPRPQPNLSAADAAPCSEGWPAPASLNGWVICPWSVLCAAKPVQKLTRPFCMSSLGMVRLSATEITARRLRPS